jgi:hypothetical protein
MSTVLVNAVLISTALVNAFTTNPGQQPTVAAEAAAGPGGEVTSLVRALALHGVAVLRSHLASTLHPGERCPDPERLSTVGISGLCP